MILETRYGFIDRDTKLNNSRPFGWLESYLFIMEEKVYDWHLQVGLD
jgi:hypothetical protein